MPRQPRLDIAGCLYHVIARGIERGKIFLDDKDYKDFLSRLEITLNRTDNKCLAWSLIPNHFHLLMLRGQRPLAELMRHLMTGYAVNFNKRHERAGHLFQNRYTAILCEEETHVLALAAYIHLNPLRAGLIKEVAELRNYRWCGHGALVGECPKGFLARDYMLSHFGDNEREAVKRYEHFVQEWARKFKRGEFSSGGLKKSLGEPESRRQEDKELSDRRILGSSEFVEKILKKAGAKSEKKLSYEEVMKEVTSITGTKPEEIFNRSQKRQVTRGRAIYCYLVKEKAGMSGAELMKHLGMTSGGICQLVERGRQLFSAKDE